MVERRGVSGWWRAATIFCLILLAVALATGMSMFEQFKAQIQHVQGKLKDTGQVKYIAVLQDEKQAPAMLVTMALQDNALQIQRLNAVSEGREDSMQLWAMRPGATAPVSLGVVQSKAATLRLPAAADVLNGVTQLAISVEEKGGVEANKGPRLPYLFQGALVQKAL